MAEKKESPEVLFETPRVLVRRSEESITFTDKKAGREVAVDPVRCTVTVLGGEGQPVLQYSNSV